MCINCSGEDGGCNQGKKNNNLKSGFDFSFSIAIIVGKMQLKIRFFLYASHVCRVEQELNFDSNFHGVLHGVFSACRRMLHTTDPEFPSMIVSGNLPSLTLHVNEQKVQV